MLNKLGLINHTLKFLCLNFLFLVFSPVLAQEENYPQDYFRSPVDIPILLSGTFGEPRSSHFHAGIDIKTQGVEGKKIYAAAEGYVSRLKISPFGYGNTIYITHPNGYVTVYAHLQKYVGDIARFAKKHQHLNKSFEINIENIPSGILKVQKGDFIAYSGNTGGSAGPHLHFEVRDTTDKVYNPLLFGYSNFFIDNLPPTVYRIFLYNLDEEKQITPSKSISTLALGGGNYKVSNAIKVNKKNIGLGVQTIDQQNFTHHKNGIYELKLYANNELLYHFKMDAFTFDVGKAVYTHCDYERRLRYTQIIHKCFIERGNLLPTYVFEKNKGEIDLENEEVIDIKIEVKDFHQNISTIEAKVQFEAESDFFKPVPKVFNEQISYYKRNVIRRGDVELNFPQKTFADNISLNIKQESSSNPYSDDFHIDEAYTPVLGYYDIAIKPMNIDSGMLDKYTMIYVNEKGSKKALGGNFHNGHFKASSKNLGLHYLSIDTIPPKITPHNIYNGKNMTNNSAIIIKASDNLSGIKEYDAFVNGEWVVLQEYDGKKATFQYTFDEYTKPGENIFDIIIRDACNNASVYSAKFLR